MTNLSFTEADLAAFLPWQNVARLRYILALPRLFPDETGERIHIGRPYHHGDEEPRFAIWRAPPGLQLEDYDTDTVHAPMGTMTVVLALVDALLAAQAAALIAAIPVLQTVAWTAFGVVAN
jgi:hypothetical protein